MSKAVDLVANMVAEPDPRRLWLNSNLATAPEGRGDNLFEFLFAKNLENVQGDERDHLIISTTYAANREGRFYRRFGSLGISGGGRRLNVLVTRARQEVHLVTSVPPELYRAPPPGQTPSGDWLLFPYLHYAEKLAEAYEANHRILEATTEVAGEAGAGASAAAEPRVTVRPIEPSSAFAKALARSLAREHGLGGDVHWGNAGFCVDVALAHPTRAEDVTLGVLCDGCRYAKTEDPLAWDAFRAAVLEGQGWRLERVWSPHFFRDPEGTKERIHRLAEAVVRSEGSDASPRQSPI